SPGRCNCQVSEPRPRPCRRTLQHHVAEPSAFFIGTWLCDEHSIPAPRKNCRAWHVLLRRRRPWRCGREVFWHAAQRRSNQEIATTLGTTANTVTRWRQRFLMFGVD